MYLKHTAQSGEIDTVRTVRIILIVFAPEYLTDYLKRFKILQATQLSRSRSLMSRAQIFAAYNKRVTCGKSVVVSHEISFVQFNICKLHEVFTHVTDIM